MSILTDILGGAASFIPGVGPAIGAGISAIGGALSNTQGARTGTSTPTIAPGYQSLADLLRARAMGRLQTGTDLGGYQAGGITNINSAYNNAALGTNANLEARGLATSPVAAAVAAKANAARAGDIGSFLNTIPLLQRQFQNEDITNGTNQVAQFGRGTSTVAPGSAIGGAFTSAAEMLAYLRGRGALGAPGSNSTMTTGGPTTGIYS